MNIFWTIYVYVAVGLVIMGVLLVIGTMITCKIGKDLTLIALLLAAATAAATGLAMAL